jgi:hypothetical protein
VAPALPLQTLLLQGQAIGEQLRERRRNRPAQMNKLVEIIQTVRN